jgi:hypothetical protein
VVISVADQLDESLARFRQLGFQLTPRGHHSLGSSNHLAIFGTDYLELLGYEPKNVAKAIERWGPDLNAIGLTGLAFKTDDADALYRDLSERGVKLEGDGAKAFFRPVELPDGTEQEARFRTIRIDPAAVPNGRIFFCQHLTPELVWRETWQQHPNGATGVSQFVIAAKDPAASVALLARSFGDALVTHIEGGKRVTANETEIDYLTPDAVLARFGDTVVVDEAGQDRMVALVLRTASLTAAAQAFHEGGVTGVQEHGERLVVPASVAYGTALVFEQDERITP